MDLNAVNTDVAESIKGSIGNATDVVVFDMVFPQLSPNMALN